MVKHRSGELVKWNSIMYKVITTNKPCEMDGSYCIHCESRDKCFERSFDPNNTGVHKTRCKKFIKCNN